MEIYEDEFEKEENFNSFFDFEDNDELLVHLFSKLYQSLNKEKVFIPSNKKILSQLKKKLFSNIKISSKDEPNIVNLLQDKAAKLSNFNSDIMNHFHNLYNKLIHRKTLSKRWEVLYLLNSLSKLPNVYIKLDFPENNCLQKKIWTIANDITGNNILDYENKFLNSKKISVEEDDDPSFESNKNEIIYIIDTNKSSLNITEKDLVTDLLYVLVGIDGQYIKYNSNYDSYILIDNIPWEENIYDIVNSISEVGWLFYKIKKYISFYNTSHNNSLYIQSLLFSIRKELEEYYKLISLLKKMNTNDLSNDINHLPLNNSLIEIKKHIKQLNLKNILMSILPYKEKLKWILTCCESVHSLHGSAILSQIYSYVIYLGNEKFLNNILNEVIKPFIEFILNWIKYGTIKDPHDEFFVKINEDINDENIWKNKYKLVYGNIPNFIKSDFVLKIFEVGKCTHFIKNFCKEKYNLNNLKKIIQFLKNKYFNEKENNDIKMQEDSEDDNNYLYSQEMISKFDFQINKEKINHEKSSYESVLDFINFIFTNTDSNKILNISFLEEIIKNINIIHDLLNKDLVRIFFQKFKFLENIEAINKYLLLGQGDMIQNLMESLYSELQKPGNTIYKYVLQSVLESAINSTNARYNDKECLNKLNIKLLKALPGDTGWDVFCLEYNIDLPLNIVISSRNILDYQKMFIFLLKIKKIEYSQNLEWRKIMTYCHNIPNSKYPFFKSKIKKSLQFNQLIMHFIISLHDYLTLEVLESQYKKLLKRIKCINSIDELILAHNEFVNSIKQKCFLDNKNNNNIIIYKKIISIFDIILRFRTAQDVLFSTLLQKISDLDEGEKSLNSQNSEEENEININYNKRIDESIKQITFLYEEFINKIIELINTMKKRLEKQNQRKNLYQDIDYNKNNNIVKTYSIRNNEEINENNEQIYGDDPEKNINNTNEDDINYNYNIYNKYTSQINNINEYNYKDNINNNNNNIKNNNYLYNYNNEEEQGDEGMEEDENNENNNNDY